MDAIILTLGAILIALLLAHMRPPDSRPDPVVVIVERERSNGCAPLFVFVLLLLLLWLLLESGGDSYANTAAAMVLPLR